VHFIIFDLEFNQDIFSSYNSEGKISHYPFEIIQIGAIKLDAECNVAATFNRYIRPTFYSEVNPFITELTGITTEQLLSEEPFPEIYKAFTEYIAGTDSVFCTWGMADMKGLIKNVADHQLNDWLLPRMYIDLQPYASKYLKLPRKNLPGLQRAVELLNIPITYTFHNAFHDAIYTAEVFKKIYHPSIQPKRYAPTPMTIRPKQRTREIDTDKLLQQFAKMYGREMTEEEQGIIKLAYKMGRTNQFLK